MKVLEYTQARLNNWYAEVEKEYNIKGSANVAYSEENYGTITITYIENGVERQFSVTCIDDKEIDYAFNVWAEAA